MKLIADVNFDMSYSFIFLHVRVHQPPTWLMMFRKKRRAASVYSARTYQSASDGMEPPMLGTTQRILVEGTSRKSIMGFPVALKITAWLTSRARRI